MTPHTERIEKWARFIMDGRIILVGWLELEVASGEIRWNLVGDEPGNAGILTQGQTSFATVSQARQAFKKAGYSIAPSHVRNFFDAEEWAGYHEP